jgi:hypothetical protein
MKVGFNAGPIDARGVSAFHRLPIGAWCVCAERSLSLELAGDNGADGLAVFSLSPGCTIPIPIVASRFRVINASDEAIEHTRLQFWIDRFDRYR